MTILLVLAAWSLAVVLLIRFLQDVHDCDEQIRRNTPSFAHGGRRVRGEHRQRAHVNRSGKGFQRTLHLAKGGTSL
jgi:hypothetical protein